LYHIIFCTFRLTLVVTFLHDVSKQSREKMCTHLFFLRVFLFLCLFVYDKGPSSVWTWISLILYIMPLYFFCRFSNKVMLKLFNCCELCCCAVIIMIIGIFSRSFLGRIIMVIFFCIKNMHAQQIYKQKRPIFIHG